MSGTQEKHLVCEPLGGAADKRNPIIFLHAMLCSKEIWTDIPQRVANETGRRVYAYDARCHGANKDQKGFSFDALVQDLDSFMTELKIEKAILVGHSMGGKTAISIALKDPKKVEKVIIVDMHVKTLSDQLVERSIKFLKFWKDSVQSLPENTPVEKITSESVPDLYSKLEEKEKMVTEKEAYLKSNFIYTKLQDGKYDVSYNAEELKKGLEKYLEDKQEEISGEYAEPAYFLYGTESPYEVGKEKDSIKKCFPKAEMIAFEGAPHHIFVHSPEEFVNVVVAKIN